MNEQHGTAEESVQRLEKIVARATPQLVDEYRQRLDMSWVYHDSALEGVVYSLPELQAAMTDQVASDPALIPTYDEIRQYRAAIALVRELADKKRSPIALESVKKLYETLAPDDVDPKTGPRYRKDMPIHRLYFHEISTPDKIIQQMRQLVDWLNDPETRKSTHPVRLAARAHHILLQIYPFSKHSGKVARLLMNLILLRNGFPVTIVHSTERQRYYEALKTGPNAVAVIVHEALLASLDSAIRFFEAAGVTDAPPPPPPRRATRRRSAAPTASVSSPSSAPPSSRRSSGPSSGSSSGPASGPSSGASRGRTARESK